MKISVETSPLTRGLLRHIQLEGDELVEVDKAELLITAPALIPVVNENRDEISHFATRFWDQKRLEFTNQCSMGVPLVGLMNNDLGVQTPVGCSCRYIKPDSWLSNEFDQLVDVLKETRSGFISMLYNGPKLVGVQTGVPAWGMYALLEGRTGKIGEMYSRAERLHESWSVALVVSAWPWPSKEVVQPYSLSGVTSDLEKHLWLFSDYQFRRVINGDYGVIGVCTGYHYAHLGEACEFAYRTAQCLDHPEKQYRTDLYRSARNAWQEIKESGVAG